MRQPNVVNADALHGWQVATQLKSGEWVVARPLGYAPIWRRVKIAWHVFTGRYDALEWTEQ